MQPLSTTPAWRALRAHSAEFKREGFRCSDLFDLADGSDRFGEFSLRHERLLLDYSRNFCTRDTLRLLHDLAEQSQLARAIEAMFSGEQVNATEGRPALHTALRTPAAENRFPQVSATLDRMADFVHRIHTGDWRGCQGGRITDVVNIGIGGSDLGPAMVTEALAAYATGAVTVHFVANVDPAHLQTTLAKLDPARTLFIIASKSFRTLETRENANSARQWFLDAGHREADIARHFVAISANAEAVREFGIAADNLLPMWDWVGGRFSLWSAIGLAIALAIGMQQFRALLAGAHSMDRHFRTAGTEQNIPVIMALLTIWYRGFFDCHSTAVVPYSHALRHFPGFLQQLCMESLGKRTTADGRLLDVDSGEVIWGTEGSNAQHSCFQLLHQGTGFIPVDFIAVAKPPTPQQSRQHQQLLANCLSQGLALLQGRQHPNEAARTAPGNRPSNTLLLAELTPCNLGALIALYEHKVFVQSVIWGINAFDQFGVELGKELSRSLHDALVDPQQRQSLDSSSRGLMQQITSWQPE